MSVHRQPPNTIGKWWFPHNIFLPFSSVFPSHLQPTERPVLKEIAQPMACVGYLEAHNFLSTAGEWITSGWNALYSLDWPSEEGTVCALYAISTGREGRQEAKCLLTSSARRAWTIHFFSTLSAFPFVSLCPVNSLGYSAQVENQEKPTEPWEEFLPSLP